MWCRLLYERTGGKCHRASRTTTVGPGSCASFVLRAVIYLVQIGPRYTGHFNGQTMSSAGIKQNKNDTSIKQVSDRVFFTSASGHCVTSEHELREPTKFIFVNGYRATFISALYRPQLTFINYGKPPPLDCTNFFHSDDDRNIQICDALQRKLISPRDRQ